MQLQTVSEAASSGMRVSQFDLPDPAKDSDLCYTKSLLLRDHSSDPEGTSATVERNDLEDTFLSRLENTFQTALAALRPIVFRLIELGATRQYLLDLAIAKGYQKSYVRSILSSILVQRGDRRRKSGAGPKTPQLALLILAFAREKAGNQAYKLLKAAAHAARKEDEAAVPMPKNQFRYFN
jgi:hypothetical protein